MHRSDVRCEDGIWFLDINDEENKQLKNAQSTRRVPLHPTLIELGFLQYIESLQGSMGKRLFPELNPGGSDNKVGFYFSKWFGRYRRKIGIGADGPDFHSFRHTVVSCLYDAEVYEPYIEELVGHEGRGGTARTHYKKQTSLQQLKEAICKIRWPEIEQILFKKLSSKIFNPAKNSCLL